MNTSTFPRQLAAVLVLVMLVLLAGGAWFYRTEERRLRQEVEAQLSTIAQLKVDQIVAWRAERLADAAVIMESPFFTQAVAQWMATPRPEGTEELLIRFRSLRDHYHYRDVLLVDGPATGAHSDAGSTVRLSLSGYIGPLHAEAAQALAAAFRDRRPVFTDLHVGPDDLPPHLDAIAPMFARNGDAVTPVGAVILQYDVRQFLYPLIQSWPTPSQSAETLLVRRDGDSVLYLNDLRHQSGAAFTLRIPLTRADLPAVMAVEGREGFVEGRDYRGVDVLSVLKAVPGSPWFMVAKVDAAEAFAPWRFLAVLILALLLGLMTIASAFLLVVWQRNAKRHFRALFQAEAARRASEERYRVTLRSAGDGVITADREGRVELLNPTAERLTGWRQEEACGKPIAEVFRIVNEETRLPAENPLDRVLHEGVVAGLANHTVLVARDGTESPIADSGAPIRDEQGAITGMVLIFRDQTEERAAQMALRESEQRFRALFEQAAVGVAQVDSATGRFIRVNQRYGDIAGYSVAEMQALTFDVTAHPDDLQADLAHMEDLVTGRCRDFSIEKNLRRKDRSLVWVALTVSAMWPPGELPTCHIIVAQDITERKRAEAERLRLTSAIEQADEMIVITDTEGTIQYVNRAFETVTGYTRTEAIGQKPTLLEIGEHAPGYFSNLWDTLSRGQTWHGRFVNKKKDGSHYTEEATISPVRDADGTIVNYVAAKRDITHELQREGQFLQAQKMEAVGQLAGGVAHDFNNKLTVILGCTGLVLDAVGADSPLRESLLDIEQAAHRAADLTRQLLTFARKEIVRPKVLDLNDSVAGLLKMLRRLIGEDIELAWIPGHDLWPVKIDPSQLDQVLANLSLNARDAIVGVGGITIETANAVLDEAYTAGLAGFSPGEYVTLTFSDDGCGMDEVTRAHIFEPFFTTKDVGKGTGLGLATVYGVVTQNHGFINVYSKPGLGTTFKVYLPRTAAAASEARVGSGGAPRGGTETVLVVEDEGAVLRLSKRILDSLGYTVLTAGTPADAIRLVTEYAGVIHVLITDVVMPEMNGRDLAERLTALKPGLKCLFMSGYAADLIAHRSILEPGARFMEKPFTRETLAEQVRSALEQT